MGFTTEHLMAAVQKVQTGVEKIQTVQVDHGQRLMKVETKLEYIEPIAKAASKKANGAVIATANTKGQWKVALLFCSGLAVGLGIWLLKRWLGS